MYINFKQLASSKRTFTELMVVLAIRQGSHEVVEAHSECLPALMDADLIQANKSGTMGLTQKGMDFIAAVEAYEAQEEALEMYEQLVELYSSYGKEIGNKSMAKKNVLWFYANTGFKKETVVPMVRRYLEENSGDIQYARNLEYLFFKPVNAYDRPTLIKSLIYTKICDRFGINGEAYLKANRDVITEYLHAVSMLPKVPSRGVLSEFFITGSPDGDREGINRVKKAYVQKLKLLK